MSFGDDAWNCWIVLEGYKCYTNGWGLYEDYHHSVCLFTWLTDGKNAVIALVHADWWLTIWEMAEYVEMFAWSCFTILPENSGIGLPLKNLFHNFLWLKKKKTDICTNFLKQVDKEENVVKLIDMGDETMVCGYSFNQNSSLHNGSQNVAQNKKEKVTWQIAYDGPVYCLLWFPRFHALWLRFQRSNSETEIQPEYSSV